MNLISDHVAARIDDGDEGFEEDDWQQETRAIREIEMKWGRYYTLLCITTYLLIALLKKEILLFPVA